MKHFSEDHKEIQSGKKLDDEGYMAQVEMDKIDQSLNKLKKAIKSSKQQLPSWTQSKITKASDYLDMVADYLSSDVEMNENVKKVGPRLSKFEEISLVDKILSEMMGDKPGCDTKKAKPLDKIAKKHDVSIDSLKKELKKGIKVEMEHTTDRGEAETIALHHLEELPNYYTRLIKMEKGAEIKEDLNAWLGKGNEGGVGGDGWDRYNSEGKRVGKCGDAKEGEPYSACLSKEKAKKLGKDGIANFVARKRKAQKNAGYGEKGEGPKGRKPVFVKTKVDENLDILSEKNEPTNPELWSKAKSLARQKFDVYPSAYANAWAAKWYKKRGGSWKSIDEGAFTYSDLVNEQNSQVIQALQNQANEFKAREKATLSRVRALKSQRNSDQVDDISTIGEATTRLPMQTGQLLRVLVNWRGKHLSVQMFFPQLGTPKRDDITYAVNKIYPDSRVISYVPCEMDSSTPIVQVKEDWQKLNKKDGVDGMSQKAVNAYKRENPGSNLQTAVTEKNPTGKRKNRQKKYCDRSKGQQEMHNIDCSETPDKPICKARRRWNCKN